MGSIHKDFPCLSQESWLKMVGSFLNFSIKKNLTPAPIERKSKMLQIQSILFALNYGSKQGMKHAVMSRWAGDYPVFLISSNGVLLSGYVTFLAIISYSDSSCDAHEGFYHALHRRRFRRSEAFFVRSTGFLQLCLSGARRLFPWSPTLPSALRAL